MRYFNFFIISTLVLVTKFSTFTCPKTVIEPCTAGSDPCTAYLSYRLPCDSKLSDIAYRFQINATDIFAANSMIIMTDNYKTLVINNNNKYWSTSLTLMNQITVPGKTLIRLPVYCTCIDGIRRLFSTNYKVKPADTLDSIAEGYGRLVSVDQIKSVNGINDVDENRGTVIAAGKILIIPLPCTCFNNRNYGAPAVYMSYVVEEGESLSSIAADYGVTANNLETINGFGHPQVDLGDILAIPLPACSSANLNWYNESLIVPNGSFALTGNGCIKCSCTPNDLDLQCSPSGIVNSCTHLQCKGSNLFIGDIIQKQTPKGCHISACIYRGHTGHKIHRSLEKSTEVQCPGKRSEVTGSSWSSTISPSRNDPDSTLSPVPSPSWSPLVGPSCGPWGIPAPKVDRSHTNNNIKTRKGSYFGVILFMSTTILAVLFQFHNNLYFFFFF